ncbi:MAG TPA: hypothetical protein VMH20_12540 [Verrucomicrobiae bacterium]|nr:hypothetical protein [Verrucomicrobiae bacterium]
MQLGCILCGNGINFHAKAATRLSVLHDGLRPYLAFLYKEVEIH